MLLLAGSGSWLYIVFCGWLLVVFVFILLTGTSDPLVPADSMDMSLGQILNSSWVIDF